MDRSRAALCFGLISVVGCAPAERVESGLDPERIPLADPWQRALGPLSGAESGFRVAGDGLTTDNGTFGLRATLTEEGAWLSGPRGEISLAFLGWGRGERLLAAEPGELETEGCEEEACALAAVERGDAREWWRNGPGGLEQGWVLRTRPEGDGALSLALRVSGAALTQRSPGRIAMVDDEGGRWAYAGPRAWDADGRSLRSWLELDGNLIRVRVDDAEARWPVLVDPVVSTAEGTWAGSGSTDAFGTAVAGRGDLNGDGYDDIAVGAPGASSGKGQVYIYYGSEDGPSATADLTLTGSASSGAFGTSVALDGDVNNDGYDDLVVGAPTASVASTSDGAAYVFKGSSSGLSSTVSTTLTGSASSSALFGWSVNIGGDLNGDGYDEVLVGEPGYSTSTGRVYVFSGSSSGTSTSTYRRFTNTDTDQLYGWSVSGGGDATGDGLADMAIGVPGYESTFTDNSGRTVTYAGKSTFFTTTPTTHRIYSQTSTSTNGFEFGTSVVLEGSIDDDDAADLLVGAPYGASTKTGRIYISYSTGSALPTGTTTYMSGSTAYSEFGRSVAWLGDTDKDGDAEIAVGIPYADSDAGEVGIFEGQNSTFETSDVVDQTISGSEAEYFGIAVAGVGDVNGDGYNDLLAGATAADGGAGQARIHYGGVDSDGDDWLVNGISTDQDCDDDNALISPGATEICDDADTDEDCDGADDDDDDDVTGTTRYYADADGDGYGDPSSYLDRCVQPSGYILDSSDCDDADASIRPGGTEICDDADTDEDCDDKADNADTSATGTSTFYADTDGDGYGDPASTKQTCDLPTGYAANSEDCDDDRDDVSPVATERCDGADTDEDCDGSAEDADASAVGQTDWYRDEDDDGYGDATREASACDAPTGYVDDATDCDDKVSTVHPGGTEICDASDTDEDCDGAADDGDISTSSATKSTWYRDADGDTYGSPSSTTLTCDLPSGYVADNQDCDDALASISPSGIEVCDDADTDEDCDGAADNSDSSASSATKSTWYRDADGDTFGDADSTTRTCDLPSGYAANDEDCDDSSASIKPGGSEICDAANTDEDCDGDADDLDSSATGQSTWYADDDGDGYGDASATSETCDLPTGFVSNDDDCDDGSASIKPGGSEICDASNTDEDCDGAADDNDSSTSTATKSTWYADTDRDSYGDATNTTLACDLPSGYVTDDEDCDDGDDDIHPGGQERCDASDVDEDCDGDADDDDPTAIGQSTWYADTDDDGWGDASSTSDACDLPGGYVDNDQDCDDGDAEVRPDGSEVCDDADTDEDCDGRADDRDASATGQQEWHRDADGDGWGDPGSLVETCDMPAGYVDDDQDCDDGDADVRPDAREVCDAADTDEDCDGDADDDDGSATGQSTWYADSDNDGYGDPDATTDACDLPAGYADNDEDCDDDDEDARPDGREVCDDANADEDCDGDADDDDDSATGQSTWYADADGDGYGDADIDALACDSPSGFVSDDTDCDDSSERWHPGAEEEDCADPNDYNCDGSVGYEDEDEDGWAACEECDDGDDGVRPDATEITGDGVDEDCDGAEICYEDADDDGYVDGLGGTVSSYDPDCDDTYEAMDDAPDGDCDDSEATTSPGAEERCDDVDNDCDDEIDEDLDTDTWYADADADGYGDPDAGEESCAAIDGSVTNRQDCDDTDAATSPEAEEVCDELDNDCDDEIDEDLATQTWYTDADDDGYGDPELSEESCAAPDGSVGNDEDCDDGDGSSWPGAEEVPNDGIDQDCDGADLVTEHTGDTSDTGDTGDTDVPEETGDTGDTDEIEDIPDGDTAGDGTGDDKDGGCACGSAPSSGGAALAFAVAGLALSRRRKPRAG